MSDEDHLLEAPTLPPQPEATTAVEEDDCAGDTHEYVKGVRVHRVTHLPDGNQLFGLHEK